MTKVVVAKLSSRRTAAAQTAIPEKRVRDASGQDKTLRVVDLHSKTFGSDLEYVFRKNVAKARRENKRLTGSSDGAPAKR